MGLCNRINFEAISLFQGRPLRCAKIHVGRRTEFLPKKTSGQWRVIVDLGRTEIPDGTELAAIKRTFLPIFLFSFSLPRRALR